MHTGVKGGVVCIRAGKVVCYAHRRGWWYAMHYAYGCERWCAMHTGTYAYAYGRERWYAMHTGADGGMLCIMHTGAVVCHDAHGMDVRLQSSMEGVLPVVC